VKISVAWKGISDVTRTLHDMGDRVDDASYEGAKRAAEIIQEQARVNTRQFLEWTGRLADSIVTDDPVRVGPYSYRSRTYPAGGESPGTPYGRIQELGGVIVAHNPSGFLWWEGFRADGSFGLIAKRSVTLKPRPYLAPALLESRSAIAAEMASVWGQAIEI